MLELLHFLFFLCLSRHTTTSSVHVFLSSISHTDFSASNISLPSFDRCNLPTLSLPAAFLTALPLFLVTPAPLLLPPSCSPARVPPAALPLCFSAWLPATKEAGERQEVLLKKGKVTLHAPCKKCFSYPAASLEKLKGDVQRVSQQENNPSAEDGCGVLRGAGGFPPPVQGRGSDASAPCAGVKLSKPKFR